MTDDKQARFAALRSADLTPAQRASLIRRRPALRQVLESARSFGAFTNYIGEHHPDAAPR